MWSIGTLDRIDGALRIAVLAAGERRNADPLRCLGDLSHRLKVALRGGGEAGLNDVHLQLGELPCNLQLLRNRESGARRLLTVAQRGVKDANRTSGYAWAGCAVHLLAPFSAAPCAPSMSTSTGLRKVICRRSSRPTFSIGWPEFAARNFL